MTPRGALPTVGLVVTTVGRPAIVELLAGAARSSQPPVVVAVADQSGGILELDPAGHPFPLVVVRSSGGASRGRNDGLAALPLPCDVVGFPNDDSSYPADLLAQVAEAFAASPGIVGVACRLEDPTGARLSLPPAGTALDRRTVWGAIEPGTFLTLAAVHEVGGFVPELGTGAGSAWGSGEITDLLLRIMASGGTVVSRPDLLVHGAGERRALDDDGLVAKHRAYARGTGYVYRAHGYPLRDRLRTLVGPLVQATRHAPQRRLSLRLALARSVGRLEGLTGRSLARGRGALQRLEPPQPPAPRA